MPLVRLHGREIPVNPSETVLDALLRAGVDAPHSCRAGACRACLVRATSGTPSAPASVGLPPVMRERGWFLACLERASADLELTYAPDEGTEVAAEVRSIERLAEDVARVRLRPRAPFSYRPGQYAVLRREDGLARPYSLASVPAEDDDLEVHVRRLPGGAFSGYVFDALRPGETLSLRGPFGECVYPADRLDQPLVLAGSGTGLAPLLGVLREALRRGHRARVDLYHGGRTAEDLYLGPTLERLVAGRAHVRYVPVAKRGPAPPGGRSGALDDVVLSDHPDLTGSRVFLCGAPGLVASLRKQAFLRGADLREIHADAFLTSAAPPRPAP